MIQSKIPVRAVQYFTRDKLKEFEHLSPQEILLWLDEANELLYQAYLSSGNPAPYDPQSWQYVVK